MVTNQVIFLSNNKKCRANLKTILVIQILNYQLKLCHHVKMDNLEMKNSTKNSHKIKRQDKFLKKKNFIHQKEMVYLLITYLLMDTKCLRRHRKNPLGKLWKILIWIRLTDQFNFIMIKCVLNLKIRNKSRFKIIK